MHLPEPTIDLLADDHNKICDEYYSRFADGVSKGVNWLSQHSSLFKRNIVYLNPPFRGDYLHLSVSTIIKKKLHGYILVPKWPCIMTSFIIK